MIGMLIVRDPIQAPAPKNGHILPGYALAKTAPALAGSVLPGAQPHQVDAGQGDCCSGSCWQAAGIGPLGMSGHFYRSFYLSVTQSGGVRRNFGAQLGQQWLRRFCAIRNSFGPRTNPRRRTDMPHTGTINFVSGIYRSDCCGVERALSETHTFPPVREVNSAAVATTQIGRLCPRRS